VSETWAKRRTATAEVSGGVCGWTSLRSRHGQLEWPCRADTDHAHLAWGGRGLRCSGPGPRPACRTSCMSMVAAPRTSRVRAGRRRAGGDRTFVRTADRPRPSMTVDTSRPHVPDTRRPDGGHSGSGGRSIRRSLVTTFSTLLKAGPAGGRLRRPSSAGNGTTGPGNRPHRSRTVRSWLSVALPSALAQHLGELRSGGSWPVALTLVERA
jgi:hypothetical protein